MKTVEQIVKEIQDIVASSECDEKELYAALEPVAEGWAMRLAELELDDE